jgi:type II secretory pathway pseudopilin PulG
MKQGGNHSGGFTIVETMIVLAVTAGLATIALAFVNGRQNTTEFMTSIYGLQQEIQQVINQTASGYLPQSGTNFKCSSTGGTAPIITTGSSKQGTNSQCVAVGSALLFGDSGGAGTPPLSPKQYSVYSLIANKENLSGADISSYWPMPDAHVVALASGTTSRFNLSPQTNTIEDGLSLDSGTNGVTFVKSAEVSASDESTEPSSSSDVAVFAFMESLNSGSTSGSQSLGLYGFPTPTGNPTNWGGTQSDTLKKVANNINDNPPEPLQSVSLCFDSGTTANQSGMITVGSNSENSLGVTLKIYYTEGCEAS